MPLAKKSVGNASTAVGEPQTQELPPQAVEPKPLTKSHKTTDTMSKAEWQAKDTRISRQGLFQAALQSTGLLQLNAGNTFEDYMALIEKAAERGVAFANKGL